MALPGYFTVSEAAKHSGRNPETIRRWIRSGRLHARRVGAQHLIDEWELEEIVQGVHAVGLAADATPEHRSFMDEVVRTLREDRDA